MENYENTNHGAEPENMQEPQENTVSQQPEEVSAPQQPGETTTPQQDGAYRDTGAGTKASPFANSPYVMNHQANENAQTGQTYQAPPARPKPPKKKRGGKAWKAALAAVLAVVLVAGGCGITAFAVNNYWEDRTSALTSELNNKIDQLEREIERSGNTGISVSGTTVAAGEGMTPGEVYARNVGAVVAISNQSISTNIYGQVSSTASSGSGFIVTENGYVVTNYHVVQGATKLTVITYDAQEYEAELVGYDGVNDLAVLKIEAEGLQSVTLGSSDDLVVGDQVVAIGNPLGELTNTLTVGYVSAVDRDVTTSGTAISMIQTDAAINSGNSGGPLFNMKGEVIGITTAKYSGTSSSGASIEGIGFAIPMDDLTGMIEDLTELGYISGAYLGVVVRDMDASAASTYGLPMGAYVQEAVDGYCAKEAGIQAKDIIVAVGEYEVGSISDLTRVLRNFEGGETTTITVFRSGSELVLDITLDEKPIATEQSTAAQESQPEEMPDGNFEEWYSYLEPFFGGGDD